MGMEEYHGGLSDFRNEYLIHLEKSLIKERMKLHLKYIVTLVITALVCIFAYQTYWLVGLYQSQERRLKRKLRVEWSTLTSWR